jgi:phospholipid/cholesterol/gamma-HCH transport system permease protein
MHMPALDLTPPAAARPTPALLAPIHWVGRSVLDTIGYVGGVVLLTMSAFRSLYRPVPALAASNDIAGFWNTVFRQLSWMLAVGFPVIGLFHVAIGSFLALQAYYGSTFIDGTGAVVGVGLLRNLGGLMTGMAFSGILAARMIPELHRIARHYIYQAAPNVRGSDQSVAARTTPGEPPRIPRGRLAAPRLFAAAVGCMLLSIWAVLVGTIVGWQAATSLMGISTDMFFMMMFKMIWFRDVVGLVFKGLLFGLLPAAVCCYEGLRFATRGDDPWIHVPSTIHPASTLSPPMANPVLRATCLGIVAILIVNASWFMLVYHAVPFYGPTLLKPPSPS